MQTFKRLLPMILMLIFELAVGIMLIINGEAVTKTVFIIFGGLTFVGGIVTLIASLLKGRNGGRMPLPALIAALIMIAVGGFFVAAIDSVLEVMAAVTVVLGLIMATNGLFKFFEYFYIRSIFPISPVALISAIVSVIVGFVIAFNPFAATESMWVIIGILIIVSAVFDFIGMIMMGSAVKKVENNS